MFDAKRKKVKKSRTFKRPKPVKESLPKKTKKPSAPKKVEKIPMKSAEKKVVIKPKKEELKQTGTRLEIVNGTRIIKRRRRIIAAGVVAVLLIAFFVADFCLPTGIIEYSVNSYMKSISGSFPLTSFSNNIKRFETKNNSLYLLNDSYLEMYSSKGGAMQIAPHSMKNPELCTSPQRTLIFDRGKTAISIFNNKEQIISFDADNNVYAADIAKCGVYAIATESVGYAAQVEVYSKNHSKIYTWYSSEDMVSDVILSDDGKMLAVSLIYAESGVLKSKVSLLNFNSASAIATFEFNAPVTSLTKISQNCFAVLDKNVCSVISWKNAAISHKTFNGVVKYYESGYDKFVYVSAPEANEQNNRITVLDKDGMLLYEFDTYVVVNGLAVSENYVYILSENNILRYDSTGKYVSSDNIYNVSQITALSGDRLIYARASTVNELEWSEG